MVSVSKRSVACALGLAVVWGTAATVAPSASAKTVTGKITISTPPTGTSGGMFTVRCKAPKSMAGSVARLREKGSGPYVGWAPFRKVSKDGNCTIHVIGAAPGTYSLQMHIKNGQRKYVSNWARVTIRV
jgi:hypothetical protein